MGLLFRTSQVAEFVHVGDPSTVTPDPAPSVWPGPDPDWLPAEGQPASATRFGVRPLSPSEWSAVVELYADQNNEGGRNALLTRGLVSVDGQQPGDLSDLGYGWDVQIGNLISAVTTRPMAGLVSRSATGPSKG